MTQSPLPVAAPLRVPIEIAHDPVCGRCGHGESLHAKRDLRCLVCDQRVSAGWAPASCVGYLTDLELLQADGAQEAWPMPLGRG